jgi:hypothetical protein
MAEGDVGAVRCPRAIDAHHPDSRPHSHAIGTDETEATLHTTKTDWDELDLAANVSC